MNDVAILRGTEPRKILQTAIEDKVPAVVSYLHRGRQHTVKAILDKLGASKLEIQLVPKKRTPVSHKAHGKKKRKPHQINIQVGKPVEISLKYGYGSFLFSTTVTELVPPSESLKGGRRKQNLTITVVVPDRIEIVQKRNFFRVNVPSSLKVNVMMWSRRYTDKNPQEQQIDTQTPKLQWTPPEIYWRGRLVDISAGGMQIVINAEEKPDFKKGQLVSLRFTPMPYETPLMFNAQIRNISKTADQKGLCFGLKVVDLKSGQPDQQALHHLCNIAEHYHRINQYSTKQQDFQSTTLTR